MLEEHAPEAAGSNAGRRVIDIGCSNGALLEYLGARWQKDGIEPSAQAAEMARRRGVNIVGAVVEDAVAGSGYDAALAIDIVEHLPNPLRFFQRVASLLKPDGVLVLLTGDTDAPAWRWQGSRYWYCSMPEHVSFFCYDALERVASASGMASISQMRLSHIRATARQRLIEAGKNIAYGLAWRVGWLPSARWRAAMLHRRAPGWLAARDHLLHVMRRHG